MSEKDLHPNRKRCSKCREVKGLDEYHRLKASTDGRQNYCVACARRYRKGRRKAFNHDVPGADVYRCERCGKGKPREDFYESRITASGLFQRCKACCRTQTPHGGRGDAAHYSESIRAGIVPGRQY